MKRLLSLIFLILSSLFFTNNVNAALVDTYNLRCNHIYVTDWEYTVIIDLKNKKVITSGSEVEEFTIRVTEDSRLDGDYITDVTAFNHDQYQGTGEGKNFFGTNLSMQMISFEQLSMPVSYMTMINIYSMGIIVDKKKDKLIFIPDWDVVDDVNKKSNGNFMESSIDSSVLIFKCREI